MSSVGQKVEWMMHHPKTMFAAGLGMFALLSYGAAEAKSHTQTVVAVSENEGSTSAEYGGSHNAPHGIGGLMCKSAEVTTEGATQTLTVTTNRKIGKDVHLYYAYDTPQDGKTHHALGDSGATSTQLIHAHGLANRVEDVVLTTGSASVACPAPYMQ